MGRAAVTTLTGLRILVAEDEVLVGFDIREELQALGAEVVGPATRVAEAMALAEGDRFDGAILDLELLDGSVGPLVDRLRGQGVAVVVSTGSNMPATVAERYPDIPIHVKPAMPDTLASALLGQLQA